MSQTSLSLQKTIPTIHNGVLCRLSNSTSSSLSPSSSSSLVSVRSELQSSPSAAGAAVLERICVVGYALNAKKLRKSDRPILSQNKKNIWSGGGLSDILTDEIEEGVSFKAFDFELPLEQQPHYHAIIHKITEDIRSNDPESRRKVNRLQNYLRLHPNTIIIDPLSCVENVISRSRVCRVLDSIIGNFVRNFGSFCPFSQPKYLIVDHTEKIYEKFEQSDLRFPVICKPIEACGTPNSHSMVVAMSLEGLSLVHCPCIIQEYWDHSATFYKVYVIDGDVMVYRRPSLPDIQQMSKKYSLRSVSFDSRYAYPTQEDFIIPNSKAESHLITNHVPLDHSSHHLSSSSENFLALSLVSHHQSQSPCMRTPLSHFSCSEEFLTFPDEIPCNDIHSVSTSSASSSCHDIQFEDPFLRSASPSSHSSSTSSTPHVIHPNSALNPSEIARDQLSHDSEDDAESWHFGYVHQTPNRGLKPGASPKKEMHSFVDHSSLHHPSSQSSPVSLNFEKSNQTSKYPNDQLIPEQATCHQDRFQEIASHLKDGFGLSLFGFDVIIPYQYPSMQSHNTISYDHDKTIKTKNEFVIIDVNFFPSYKEVSDFPSRLRTMLRKKSGFDQE